MGALDGKVAIVTGTSRGVGVGIAHELLRAGAAVIGCSRSPLDALPGTDAEPDWARRSAQMTCDQGDYRAIDALVSQVAATYGRIDILVNNAGGTVPTPNVEDVPALVQRIQGAPRSDDDYERTVLFHSFAIQMNLISPLWFAIRVYRQMRRAKRHRVDRQHLQRRGPSRRCTDAGVLRRRQGGSEPLDPIAGRGMGSTRPRQLPGPRPDHDR